IACLAIAGVPPFSGFFSKEEILLAAFHHNQIIYWIALITAGITAFYMFRLYFNIFWKSEHHPHSEHHGEGPWTMLLPLVLLCIGAAFAGLIPFGNFVTSDGKELLSEFHLNMAIAPVAVGLAGIFFAMRMYKTENDLPDRIATSLSGLYQAAYRKFYIDEIYLFVTKKIIFNLIGRPAAWFDRNIVDGLIDFTGETAQTISETIRGFQSGKVQNYTVYFFGGVIGFAILFIYILSR
ncbi:MAG: NADH-quinone oxidoreductase subunit L, partial [Bacteroidia bacterium]|nr:NADH-quinone oxidoreductase subunit L [Bacteroidia bacterium]